MEWLMENLALVVGVVVFVIFTIGLVLAMRTQAGRDKLAGASVRLAVACLALAERWLGGMLEPEGIGDSITLYRQPVAQARAELSAWLGRR